MKRLIAGGCTLLVLAVHAQPQSSQVTHGWCSPAVSNVSQKVTIICSGVDPKALARLNELLELKDQQLGERIREAEEWAKKFNELNSRLAATSDPSENERRSMILLKEGRLEEAGQLLDDLLKDEGDLVRRLARNNFNRAEVYALQFYPVRALPYYRKAYQLTPENVDYTLALANVLNQQRENAEAQALYERALAMTESGATASNVASLLVRAKAQEGMARVVKFNESFDYLGRAVSTYRRLEEVKPDVYTFELARSLSQLIPLTYVSDLSSKTNVSEKLANEAAGLFETLAARHPEKRSYYLAYAMGTLMNLAAMRSALNRKANPLVDRIIGIHEKIRAASADYLSVDMAGSFSMVAFAYLIRGQLVQAEEATGNAIAILEKHTVLGDEHYVMLPQLYWMRSMAFSRLYKREQALFAIEQGVRIQRQLAERSPKQYEPMLSSIMDQLAQAQRDLSRHEDAKRTEQEMRAIREKYGLK